MAGTADPGIVVTYTPAPPVRFITANFPQPQNSEYRCASGSTVAGSHLSGTPSARTSYNSGSTWIFGVASFSFISRLPILRQLRTGSSDLLRQYPVATP